MESAHLACPTATAPHVTFNMFVPSAITLIRLYASFGASAAGTETYTIAIRDNGTTVMSCSISDANTDSACTATGPVSVSAGHFLQAQFSTVNGTGKQPKVALTFQ